MSDPELSDPENIPEFEVLLDYLKQSRGFDFTGYKRASLMRRIDKRMQAIKVAGYGNYQDYLEVDPEEFTHLFNGILINVTAFFRDGSAWDYLATEILPQIVTDKGSDPIRIWSAGCASGEEAYTLTMALAEVMGVEALKERVKIFATDVDTEALNQARLGSYSAQEVEGIPPLLLERYFEPAANCYVFNKNLRRSVIFGRHDLLQDAPISRIDLLVCRNTLMYFNTETQAQVLERFHFAIKDSGFAFLGKAEMLFTQTNLLTPVDLRWRLFTKVSKAKAHDHPLFMTQLPQEEVANNAIRLQKAAFEVSSIAELVVDLNGYLVLSNGVARRMFNLTSRDLGRPLQDLELSYKPVELRSLIEQVYSEHHSILLREVAWSGLRGEASHLDVQVMPLLNHNQEQLGVKVVFVDVTHSKQLQKDLEQANQELETAYEELQSSNEELETTNEELQSSNEELETTNEELQSSNEELETMNEELQSTNEELHAINKELSQRSFELNEVNASTDAILGSLRAGVVVTDQDLLIQIWSAKAEDLWGLRAAEVKATHFLTLDIGLPVYQLKQPLCACIAKEIEYHEVILEAINRRGKAIQCKVTCTPLLTPDAEVRGVILLMTEESEAASPLMQTLEKPSPARPQAEGQS